MYPFDINLLKSITFSRILNSSKVITGFFLSTRFKKVVLRSYPHILMIEPTNICNLACPLCPSGTKALKRKQGMLTMKLLDAVLDDVGRYVWYLMLYFEGEPFLNKDILSFVKKAKKKRIYTLISTNLHHIESTEDASAVIESGLDALVICLDGATEEVYKKYRTGGDFQKVINGIKLLVRAKHKAKVKQPKLYLQFLVMKGNEHQVQQIKELAKSLKIDKLYLKSIQINPSGEEAGYLPDSETYSRYERKNGAVTIKGKVKNACYKLWSTAVITWDGTIVPCCFDKDGDYSFGAVGDGNSLKDIWYSQNMNNFRKTILHNRKAIPICTNCTEGLG